MIAYSEQQLQYGIEIKEELNRLLDSVENTIKTNPPMIADMVRYYLQDTQILREQINDIEYASEIIEKYQFMMCFDNDYKKLSELCISNKEFKISPIMYAFTLLKREI